MYVVINTLHADDKHFGIAESKHFTEEAAEKSAAKILRAVKRRNGASSYLPLTIVYIRGHVSKGQLVPHSSK